MAETAGDCCGTELAALGAKHPKEEPRWPPPPRPLAEATACLAGQGAWSSCRCGTVRVQMRWAPEPLEGSPGLRAGDLSSQVCRPEACNLWHVHPQPTTAAV